MQSVVPDDSPLAAYLEGRGEADSDHTEEETKDRPTQERSEAGAVSHGRPKSYSFAPKPPGPSSSKPPGSTTRPGQVRRQGTFSRIRSLYALAVTSTLGPEDNERFLEHFRYIIIASQLLNEHTATNGFSKVNGTHQSQSRPASPDHTPAMSISLAGALISAGTAFLIVWLLNWARGPASSYTTTTLRKGRIVLVSMVLLVLAVVLYAYVRRQWLQYLRRQAVDTAGAFVANAQSFEHSSISIITLIQEVELVSRGYRISTPLPPITRLDATGDSRRCVRLRRNMAHTLTSASTPFATAIESLRPYIVRDDFERFLDVYDLQDVDIQEAMSPLQTSSPLPMESEQETLRNIRIHQFRLSVLRRVFLCSLLSIPATGRAVDAQRWRTAVHEMETLSTLLHDLTTSVTSVLQAEESLLQPSLTANQPASSQATVTQSPFSSSSPASSLSPTRARLTSQLTRISSLSAPIRSLQARLHLLRESSADALASSTSELDIQALSSSFRDQYDALGADLAQLMAAYNCGREALRDDIVRHERRLSLSSITSASASASARGSLRASGGSLGGLSIVDEDASSTPPSSNGTLLSPRSTAFRALHGDGMPLSPPTSDDGKNPGEEATTFEATATPAAPRARPYKGLSREERLEKMREERGRSAVVRERREAREGMVRELRAVINLRPSSVHAGQGLHRD